MRDQLEVKSFEAATSRAENLELTNLSRLKSASKDTTFSQIEELKTNLGEEDEFLIREAKDGYVITSSSVRVETAGRMSDPVNLLSNSCLYIDGCETTLRDKGCEVKLVTYHPVLKKVLWLAKIKAPGMTESPYVIRLLLQAVDVMTLQKTGSRFAPHGPIVSDEAGAIELGVEMFYGKKKKNEVQSCLFHFRKQENAVSRYVTDESDNRYFKALCSQFLDAVTPLAYQNILSEFQSLRDKYQMVDTFVGSYNNVRHKIVKCFMKNSRSIQSASLAEASNWSSQAGGNKRLTLFDSVVRDCVESAKLNAQYRLILREHPINTTGPSDHQTHQRELAEERSQTSTVTNQILESLRAEPSDVLATFDSYTQKTDPRRTSRIDKLKDSEQSIGSDSRPFGYPYRSTQSNSFKESLSHVFPPETGMKYLITSYTKEINLIAINMRGERDKVCVKISSIPHCNCTFRVKKPKAVCRHIIFVLLFICNLHPTSLVIHQIAYSQNELKEILGGAPSGIENLSADLRG